MNTTVTTNYRAEYLPGDDGIIVDLSEHADRLMAYEDISSELSEEQEQRLVNYIKSLNTPVICFPKGIKNYKEFCEIIKPDAISIDYNVDPKNIVKDLTIPIQGGLDPKILLLDKETLKKEAIKYLEIFKDHPYIFNLGHGVLPETKPEMVDYLVKLVKNY